MNEDCISYSSSVFRDILKKIIVVITASTKEYEAVLENIECLPTIDYYISFDDLKKSKKNILGQINNYPTLLIQLYDQGSMESRASIDIIQSLLQVFEIEIFFCVGICFGVHDTLKKGDVVISSCVSSYEKGEVKENGTTMKPHYRCDTITDAFLKSNKSRLESSNHSIHHGKFISGEKRVSSLSFIENIRSNFPSALAGDMESAGLSLLAHSRGIKWCVVKSISDYGIGDKKDGDKNEFLYVKNAADILKQILYLDNINSIICDIDKNFDYYTAIASLEGRTTVPYYNLRLKELLRFEFPRIDTEPISHSDNKTKIHYEYASFPSLGQKIGFLLLGKDIIIRKTLEHVVLNQDIKLSLLYILTPRVFSDRTGRANFRVTTIKKALTNSDLCSLETNVSFVEEYILERSQQFLKNFEVLYTTKYYVDQPLTCISNAAYSIQENGIETLCDILTQQKQLTQPIISITGEAGIGKSTLCKMIANQINKQHNNKKICAIYLANDNHNWIKPSSKIGSLYSLYLYFDTINQQNREDGSPDRFDYNSFILNVLCGNLVLIIDGLDEITSALGIDFDIEEFIKSIEDLNNTFNQCKILIAFRSYYTDLVKNSTSSYIYKLNGFDRDAVNKFFTKKFNDTGSNINQSQKDSISSCFNTLKTISNTKYYNPLIADLIAEIELRNYELNDNISDFGKYLDCNQHIEKLIVLLLTRENRKQNIKLTTDDAIEILLEVTINHGGKISKLDFIDTIRCINTEYTEKSDASLDKIMQTPFLMFENGIFLSKYSYIDDIFKARLLIYSIKNNIYNDPRIKKILIDISYGSNDILNIIKQSNVYFNRNLFDYLKSIYDFYKDSIPSEKNNLRRCIAGIIILALSKSDSFTKKERTDILITIFGKDMHYFSIYSNIAPLDFTSIKIIDGYISDCEGIFKSIFPNNVCFIKTKIYLSNKAKIKIPNGIFDPSCEYNENTEKCIETTSSHRTNIINDIKLILNIFFANSSFVKYSRNRVSQRISKLNHFWSLQKALDTLTDEKILVKIKNKNEELFFVSDNMQSMVCRFLTEDIISTKIESVINLSQ